jgi:hypothetical protein
MLEVSNMMDSELEDSKYPKVDNNAFHYDGKLWRTSRADIAHGIWAKYSKIE